MPKFTVDSFSGYTSKLFPINTNKDHKKYLPSELYHYLKNKGLLDGREYQFTSMGSDWKLCVKIIGNKDKSSACSIVELTERKDMEEKILTYEFEKALVRIYRNYIVDNKSQSLARIEVEETVKEANKLIGNLQRVIPDNPTAILRAK